MGMGIHGMGWDGRKSLKALILRAPLCGANNRNPHISQHNTRKVHEAAVDAFVYENCR